MSYTVADGTATIADGDYTSSGSSVTIPAGSLSANIPLAVLGDAKFEPDETFQVTLTGSTGAPLGSPVTATVTIANDDPLPTVIVSDTSSLEGNSGATMQTFRLTLSNPSSQLVGVSYATHDGTATLADGDYQSASGPIDFSPGTLSRSVSVSVNGDVVFEPDETYTLDLSNPVNVTIADGQGIGTILNDDGVPALSIADASAPEGNTGSASLPFVVTLSHASDQPVTAHVATLDGTATTADADYLALSASLTIPAFATTDTVRVTVNGDLRCEPDEQFRVVLSSLVGAAAADTEATGAILNDDECTAVNGPADEFALAGIAPNPTAGATRVEYSLRSEARVRLTMPCSWTASSRPAGTPSGGARSDPMVSHQPGSTSRASRPSGASGPGVSP